MKEIILDTKDSEKIYANWFKNDNSGVILICHGLLEYKDSSTFRSISGEIAKNFDVLTIDMRGHGKSTGKYTYGAKEALDIQAGIDFLKTRYSKTVLMGFSLGASVSLEAAVKNKCVDGLILISPPASFSKITLEDAVDALLATGEPMRVLHGDLHVWNVMVSREGLAPFDPSPERYQHNRTGEDNGDAHHKRQIMGREVVVAVTEGKLDFGPWEQIFYGEFDGRRPKRVLVKIIGQ